MAITRKIRKYLKGRRLPLSKKKMANIYNHSQKIFSLLFKKASSINHPMLVLKLISNHVYQNLIFDSPLKGNNFCVKNGNFDSVFNNILVRKNIFVCHIHWKTKKQFQLAWNKNMSHSFINYSTAKNLWTYFKQNKYDTKICDI